MVLLLFVSGLLEGISVISLVPLMEIAVAGQGSQAASGIGEAVQQGLLSIGIQPTLSALMGVVVVGITLKAIFLWLAMREVGYTVAKVTLDLRLQLVRALLEARWSYHGSQPIGAFANSITREAVRSAAAYQEACVVLGGIMQATIYLVISALISWEVTLAALLTGGVLLWGLRRFIAMGRAAGQDEAVLTRRLSARLVDAMQGIKPMKAMAREDLFWPLLQSDSEGLNQASRRSVNATQALRLVQEPAVTLVVGIGLVLLLTVRDHSFSAVIVLAFVFYRLMTNLNNLQMRYQTMVAGEGMFWSLREQIDDARAAAEDHLGTRRPRRLSNGIELRGVHFAYGDLPVLKGLDLIIPAGRITALIGESGSGKTTILDLVTGLRRPDQGEIFVDGVPLNELNLKNWRELIGYVPQEVFLFHDTVLRNITLGDETISEERVERALKDAGAWDFIARHPQGLYATISPQGSNLSGGQRQRLAIARALVKEPSLMVLDEATSGLDTLTEAAILETLEGLRDRVTILAISHQPALRAIADHVIELQAGAVFEQPVEQSA